MNKLRTYLPKMILSTFMLMVFLMPLLNRFVPILIAVLSLLILWDGFLNKNFSFSYKKIVVTAVLFYVFHLISVLYSDYKEVALFDMGVKFSLVLFPLIFLFKNQYVIQKKNWVLWAFVTGSLVSSLLMLSYAFWRFDGQDTSVFYYVSLSLFHPSYMAMYFIFSILILIDFIGRKESTKKQKLWSYLLVLFLVVIIFLLQSKAGILSLVLIVLYYSVFALIKKRFSVVKISILVLVVSIGFISLQRNSRLQTMTQSIEKISEEGQAKSSTGIRYDMWKVTLRAISENWLFGVGAGDIKPVLFKKYEVQKLEDAINNNYNVHNQYLETFLGQGIFGLGLLLLLLLFGLLEAIKRNSLFLSGFVLLLALSLLPESMLNQQAGVIFMAFFYYFLFTYDDV